MSPTRTNERPGTRAVARDIRISARKVRPVLDLIRGKDVQAADEVLQFSDRDPAIVIRKLLRSAVANAEHNDEQLAEDLYISACFADEGRTLRRFRPRARGRATRIRKRSCHITLIVARLPEEELERRREREAARPGTRAARRAGQQAAEERRRRTRRSRRGEDEAAEEPTAADVAEAESEQGIVDQQAEAVAQAERVEEAGDVSEPDGAAADADVVDQQGAALAAADEKAGAAAEADADPAEVAAEPAAGVPEPEGAAGGAEAEIAAEPAPEDEGKEG